MLEIEYTEKDDVLLQYTEDGCVSNFTAKSRLIFLGLMYSK